MKRTTTNKPANAKDTSPNENFSFGSGRTFADNDEYAGEGIVFDILAIVFELGRGYEGRDRWAVHVKAADRDCEILSLGSNPGRDEELRKAQAHLESGGSITNKRLRRSGNAYYFTDGGR